MNYRQLQYAVLLSQIGSFSQVAEKLSITQPALSKQILSLEKELDVQLFDRNKYPVILTPAGEHFIKAAQDLLYREDQLLRSMEEYKNGDKGQLTIGITPFRSAYLIPKTVKAIRKKYPGIQVKLHEAGSGVLRKEAGEGKFDFAVINMPVDDSVFDVVLIEPDSLAVVIPEEILCEYSELRNKKEVIFSDCRDLPFAAVGLSQEMRQLFERLCTKNGFSPNIAVEVVSLTTAWEMAISGVAATVLPLQFVGSEHYDKKVSVLKIKDAAYLRQPAIVTRKGQYISPAARYAMDTLTKIQGK